VGDAVVEALFSAYFERGRDIGSRAVLAEIAGDAGMNAGEVRDAQDDCVTSVPTYSFDGFLLPGAQEPKVLAQLIGRILEKRRSKT